MLTESKAIYDGLTTVTRGMDSGRAPSLIGPDQVAMLVNGHTRTGYVQNRPGWSKLALSGDSFQLGRWQGAHIYVGEDGRPFLVASIGGQILRFDPIQKKVLNLSATSGIVNSATIPQAWFCQAETFLIIQDNSSIGLVFDGGSLRRARPVAFGGTEFPVGNVMEYNNGRLWVALQDRRTFGGGDLAYSVTGAASDVLGWTQNTFLSGGAFALPSSAGFITAMRSLALQDSVLGQGPLIVFGQFGAATVNAPFNADSWQNTDSPIVSVGLLSQGPTSQEATINVNGDLWYRSRDGVRTYMVARRDHNTWVNTPISHEMTRILTRDDLYLLDHASAVDFDNRHLMTVSPFRATYDGVEYGVAFRGLSVLDFVGVSSMFERQNPAWDGLWNGVDILQILTVNCYGVDRCFMFVLNSCQEIELWELSRDSLFDNLTDRVRWQIETRSFSFQDRSEFLKQLVRTETWIERIVGSLAYEIRYRPDAFSGWVDLDSGSVCAGSGMCTPPTCTPPVPPQPQYRARKISSSPDPSDCEECVDKQYRNGFEFAFQLTLTGAASLRRFRAVATELPENPSGGCLGTEDECCREVACESSPFEYQTSNDCAE